MRMALLCFLGVLISGPAHSADTEPKEVFENYRKAILEAKGASADLSQEEVRKGAEAFFAQMAKK